MKISPPGLASHLAGSQQGGDTLRGIFGKALPTESAHPISLHRVAWRGLQTYHSGDGSTLLGECESTRSGSAEGSLSTPGVPLSSPWGSEGGR